MDLLLAVAVNADGTGMWEARVEAAKALRTCGSPDVATKLVWSLRPDDALELRLAIGEALSELPCNDECVAGLLGYLEQGPGRPACEERSEIPECGCLRVQADCRKAPASHLAYLYSVLLRNKEATLACLERHYGLGTEAVSTFALEVVRRLQLREACFLLLGSEEGANCSREFLLPRKEILNAVTALKCR